MCGEVVAAPLSLQDTVYPILRKKSLHFCEKSKKFLKLCTAVRKKYKMKRLRRKTELPQSKPDGFASSLGEGASGAPGAHSTASEMSLPSSSTSTTSIIGRMKRAPFFRAKWDPSRLPRMLLTAQGMPMWNTTRPFIR